MVYDVFTAPYPDRAIADPALAWTCWRWGNQACAALGYPTVGMQLLLAALRRDVGVLLVNQPLPTGGRVAAPRVCCSPLAWAAAATCPGGPRTGRMTWSTTSRRPGDRRRPGTAVRQLCRGRPSSSRRPAASGAAAALRLRGGPRSRTGWSTA
ncbi:hypothetical protein ACLQ24_22285 [Micromonospora sp. DT4]|uniref:hypothetical protein n=1 Tax=Micromonospora sp. DT4 TaxID=3393438 RepID=UPI003CF9078E